MDDRGLLWIVMAVKDPGWVPGSPGEDLPVGADATPRHEMFDLRYEVIDPVAGQVLASGWIDRTDNVPLAPVFPGTRLDYCSLTDSLGFETIQFHELALVPQDR